MIYDGNETYYVHPLPNNTDKVNVTQFNHDYHVNFIDLWFSFCFSFSSLCSLTKGIYIGEAQHWTALGGAVLLACKQALRGTLSVGRKRGRACSQVSSIPDTCKCSSFFALPQEQPREPAYRLGHSL